MEKLFITNNNVKVFSYEMPALHGFCLTLNIKAGKMYEQTAGIAHLLEHMFFRRLDDLNQVELYRQLDKYGFEFNGETYKEFLRFYLTGNIKYFKQACEIFCKLLAPAMFTADDLKAELKRICRELKEDDAPSTIDYIAEKAVWKDAPIVRLVLPSAMKKISLKSLKKEKEKIFTADNMFFYVTGNLEKEHLDYLLCQIERYQINASAEVRDNSFVPPENFLNRRPDIHIKKSDYNYVAYSFDYDAKKYAPFEIDLLYDLLFTGNSGTFYYALSEKKGLIYDYDCYLDRYSNVARFYFKHEISTGDLYESIAATVDVLHEIKNNISDFDFERAKFNYVENDLLLDDVERLNWQFAFDNHILSYGYKDLTEYGNLYKNTAKERIKTIAQEIFQPKNLTLVIKSKKDLGIDKLKEIIDAL